MAIDFPRSLKVDPQRNDLYYLEIEGFKASNSIAGETFGYVKTISEIPIWSLDTTMQSQGQNNIHYIKGRGLGDLTIAVYEDSNHSIRNFMLDWYSKAVTTSGRFYPKKSYTKRLTIKSIARSTEAVNAKFEYDAFPVRITGYSFDTEGDKHIVPTITFKVELPRYS